MLAELETAGGTTLDLRRRLAGEAYARTAAYDAAIAAWFAAQRDEAFPARLTVAGTLRQGLRYGENPHQQAAFYTAGPARPGVATATQVQGKELSYNNLNDTDAAFECAAEFDGAGGGDRQARQPVRRRDRPEPRRGLGCRAALRPGVGLRRHHRGQPHAG